MFRVGMKVVCVDDGKMGMMGNPYISKGAIYTVSSVRTDSVGILCLWLDGIPFGWCAIRFRPVTSPKQEVSFTTGAPVDSERWDNRVKRKPQKAVTALQS